MDHHDYAWNVEGQKAVSINHHGLTAKEISLVDYLPNTQNGVEILNKIDLRERVRAYDLAFSSMSVALAAATDFDSLRTSLLTAIAGV